MSGHSEQKADEEGTSSSSGLSGAETDRYGFLLGNGEAHTQSDEPCPQMVRHREMKWLGLMNHWDQVLEKKNSKIKGQCQKGIPASLRAKCWPLLCGATHRKAKNAELYKTLDSAPGQQSWIDVIKRDTDRQFPFHEMFLNKDGHGQQGLLQVLKAYTEFRPEEGYCQAQGPVAAVLLMNMPIEEAFWCLVQISELYLPGYYSPLLEGVLFDAAILSGVLKRTCPAAYKHMQGQGVEPLMFATDWLMCLYSRHLPFNTLLRVWDLFFCYGVRVLFQVAVVLVRRCLGEARQRKECEGQMETLEQLRAVRGRVQHEPTDAFIQEVCSVALSLGELQRLTEKEFEKWRKERPGSTFDPRDRCHGFYMVWEKGRVKEKENEKKERQSGNLTVPLMRSHSSLSPAILRKKWRKRGSKAEADEWEGGGRRFSQGVKEENSDGEPRRVTVCGTAAEFRPKMDSTAHETDAKLQRDQSTWSSSELSDHSAPVFEEDESQSGATTDPPQSVTCGGHEDDTTPCSTVKEGQNMETEIQTATGQSQDSIQTHQDKEKEEVQTNKSEQDDEMSSNQEGKGGETEEKEESQTQTVQQEKELHKEDAQENRSEQEEETELNSSKQEGELQVKCTQATDTEENKNIHKEETDIEEIKDTKLNVSKQEEELETNSHQQLTETSHIQEEEIKEPERQVNTNKQEKETEQEEEKHLDRREKEIHIDSTDQEEATQLDLSKQEEETQLDLSKQEEETQLDLSKQEEETQLGLSKQEEETQLDISKQEEETQLGLSKQEEETQLGLSKQVEETQLDLSKQEEETQLDISKQEEETQLGLSKQEEETQLGLSKQVEETQLDLSKQEEETQLDISKQEEKTQLGLSKQEEEMQLDISKQEEETQLDISKQEGETPLDLSKQEKEIQLDLSKQEEKILQDLSKQEEETQLDFSKQEEEIQLDLRKQEEEKQLEEGTEANSSEQEVEVQICHIQEVDKQATINDEEEKTHEQDTPEEKRQKQDDTEETRKVQETCEEQENLHLQMQEAEEKEEMRLDTDLLTGGHHVCESKEEEWDQQKHMAEKDQEETQRAGQVTDKPEEPEGAREAAEREEEEAGEESNGSHQTVDEEKVQISLLTCIPPHQIDTQHSGTLESSEVVECSQQISNLEAHPVDEDGSHSEIPPPSQIQQETEVEPSGPPQSPEEVESSSQIENPLNLEDTTPCEVKPGDPKHGEHGGADKTEPEQPDETMVRDTSVQNDPVSAQSQTETPASPPKPAPTGSSSNPHTQLRLRRSSTSQSAHPSILSEDTFREPNQSDKQEHTADAANTTKTTGQPQKSEPHADKPKRRGLFHRFRGETSPKTTVPKILIQDFSEGEQKLSSKERRRRRREQERREKEEEKERKKREKELEKEKEKERKKPQTRGKSFQALSKKSEDNDIGPGNSGSQTLGSKRNSAPHSESYF